MALDPSIYDRLGQGVTPLNANSLAMIGQVAQTGNALLDMQTRKARIAQGQAMQSAIRPDGSYDTGAANAAMAADPTAAPGIQEAITGNQSLSQAQQTQQLQKLSYIAGINTGLINDPNLTAQKAQATIASHVGDGIFTAAQAAQLQSTMPSDPDGVRDWLTQHQIANLNAQQAALGVRQNVTVSDGQNTLGGTQAPAMQGGAISVPGQRPGQNGVPLKLSPGQLATDATTGFNPDGTPKIGTVSQQLNVLGVGQNGQPLPGGALGTGRNGVPDALNNPAKSPPPANGTQVATGGGYTISPPSPQALKQNQDDQEGYQKAISGIGATQASIINLQHAKTALDTLAQYPVATGPGSQAYHKVMELATTFGIAPQAGADWATNYDLAKKALVNYAASTGAAAHTDLGLQTAAAGNASVDGVTLKAAQTVVNQNLGNLAQSKVLANEAQSGLVGAANGVGFTKHASDFTQSTDPRAFAFDSYDPQDRAKIIADLGPKGSPAYNKFVTSLALAKKYNLIQPPVATQATQPNQAAGY